MRASSDRFGIPKIASVGLGYQMGYQNAWNSKSLYGRQWPETLDFTGFQAQKKTSVDVFS
jgi:hypothetical protein